MYTTKTVNAQTKEKMRLSLPSPLGHAVTGYDQDFNPVIETMSEITAAKIETVKYIRHRMPNGKYEYREIVSRP